MTVVLKRLCRIWSRPPKTSFFAGVLQLRRCLTVLHSLHNPQMCELFEILIHNIYFIPRMLILFALLSRQDYKRWPRRLGNTYLVAVSKYYSKRTSEKISNAYSWEWWMLDPEYSRKLAFISYSRDVEAYRLWTLNPHQLQLKTVLIPPRRS